MNYYTLEHPNLDKRKNQGKNIRQGMAQLAQKISLI